MVSRPEQLSTFRRRSNCRLFGEQQKWFPAETIFFQFTPRASPPTGLCPSLPLSPSPSLRVFLALYLPRPCPCQPSHWGILFKFRAGRQKKSFKMIGTLCLSFVLGCFVGIGSQAARFLCTTPFLELREHDALRALAGLALVSLQVSDQVF